MKTFLKFLENTSFLIEESRELKFIKWPKMYITKT